MSENKGQKRKSGKAPQFNFYWIYAIIFILLISINLFSWTPSAKDTSY